MPKQLNEKQMISLTKGARKISYLYTEELSSLKYRQNLTQNGLTILM